MFINHASVKCLNGTVYNSLQNNLCENLKAEKVIVPADLEGRQCLEKHLQCWESMMSDTN